MSVVFRIGKGLAVVAVAATCVAGSAREASAVTERLFGLFFDGEQQVHELENGNRLGLLGIDNRESNGGTGAKLVASEDDLKKSFLFDGWNVAAFYHGAAPLDSAAAEFDPLSYGFTVAADAYLPEAIWVEWTGPYEIATPFFSLPVDLVFATVGPGASLFGGGGGTTALSPSDVTLPGDPLATIVPTPLPAGAPLALGAFALAAALRRFGSRRAPA